MANLTQQDPEDDVLLPPPDYSDTHVRRNSTRSLIQTHVPSSENTVSSALTHLFICRMSCCKLPENLNAHSLTTLLGIGVHLLIIPVMWQQHSAYTYADTCQEFQLRFMSNINMRKKYDRCGFDRGVVPDGLV